MDEDEEGDDDADADEDDVHGVRDDRGPCGHCEELVFIDQKRHTSKETGIYFHGAGAGCRAGEDNDLDPSHNGSDDAEEEQELDLNSELLDGMSTDDSYSLLIRRGMGQDDSQQRDDTARDPYTKRGRTPAVLAVFKAYGFP